MNYLILGDIQDEIIEYHNKYNQGYEFMDAAASLRAKGKTYHGIPEYPDFLSWNTMDLEGLKSLVAKIPVALDEIRPINPTYHPSVQINLEFFNPSVFKELHFVTILYVIKGIATFHTHSDSLNLNAGDLLILSPDLAHQLSCTSEDIVINIISEPELFKEHFSQILSKNTLLSNFFHLSLQHQKKMYLRFNLTPSAEILNIIKHLFAEFKSLKTFSTEVFLNYLQILYAHILRNCDNSNTYNGLSTSKQLTILPSILLYLQKHFKTLTLSELAEHFNYTPAYLSRLIKQETGKNFNKIVAEMKTKEAKQLLTHTEYSIGYIAELVGYNSADHFGYCFKKMLGTSPSQYRKIQRD